MIQYSASDGVCVLRLHSPPVNAITFLLLDALRAAVRRACADVEVRGIVLTGDPAHFSAGADVKLFREIRGSDDAVRTSRLFQEAFQEVEDSPKPIVAAVAGKVLGSALELAMSCHFRVCAGDTRLSMPEVTLGINPGAGGTGRLPRLIGVEHALRMLLTGGAVGAEEALALGLVDAVCGGEDLLERSRDLLRSAPEPRKTRRLTEKVRDSAANDAAFAKAKGLATRTRPELIAPSGIVEAARAGLERSFEAGLRKEQEVFAQCMATLGTQNKIYLFFAARDLSKASALGDVEPARVAQAAVVGMGSMGTGIAHALILGGVPVVVLDEDEAALDRGMAKISRSVEKRVAQGKLSEERAEAMLSLVAATTDWAELADADLVIEAVFEEVAAKRTVLGHLEEVCRPDTIVASNTSTISLDVLAERMERSERLIGLHFFNPAHRMPLVEVVRRATTPGRVLATAVAFAKAIRKTPVVVRNREGFLVNRIFIPYVKEAFWLLEEGAEAPAIDAVMVQFGFPMGPLARIDMTGLDVLVFTDRVLTRAFPAHGRLSEVATRLVERGPLGQKTGSGVYRYEAGEYAPHPSEASEAVIAEVRREAGRGARAVGTDEITRRLVLRMVGGAFDALEEGIAERESDVDAATVLGMGFPDFRGGVLKYAHDLGLDSVVTRLDELADRSGKRFAPCKLLRERKGTR